MNTINQILDAKGHDVWSIGPEATVYDAIALMAEKGIGALLVTDAGKPVGIISERDYARKVILKDKSSKETKIKDIMTSSIVFASSTQTVEKCMAIMTENHIRHLPVTEDGQVCGMIAIGDLVKSIIADQKFQIEQLEHYVSG